MIITLPKNVSLFKWQHDDKLRVLPTRLRRKPVGIHMKRNYVTVTLSIRCSMKPAMNYTELVIFAVNYGSPLMPTKKIDLIRNYDF